MKMTTLKVIQETGSGTLSRRALFSILPAGAFGCLGCVRSLACPQGPQALPTGLSWTEKADVTWEELFRFAYQKDLIPLLKVLEAQFGREEFSKMLRAAADEVVRRKTAGRPPSVPDLVSLASNMHNVPPIMQHALDAEIVEQSPEAFEYRVKSCLWARVFRDMDAADIGYSMICYPDYPVAKSLNPKLRLIRTKTLMQGDDSCSLRYVMDA